jgi:hypothetical protein
MTKAIFTACYVDNMSGGEGNETRYCSFTGSVP